MKVIDERKTAKNNEQQAKATPEKEDAKTKYLNLKEQVERNCMADKSKLIQENKKKLKELQVRMMRKFFTELFKT